jgi:aminoglycoside phosphotransferase (APT) family kinase protein
VLQDLVPGFVPAVVATVPAWHAFIMDSAPAGSETWKWHLMRGEVDVAVARQAGSLLGRIHATSAERPALATGFGDRSFFDELRIDPYLRFVAAGAPRLRPALDDVIAELLEPGRCLVHGDFSPKNLLVSPAGELLLVDHEVAHWGHPAFDIGFVTCHLLLKSIRFRERCDAYLEAAAAVLNAYAGAAGTIRGGLGSFAARVTGALLVARVDGKSPVEYLTEARDRELARALGSRALLDPPTDPWALVSATRAALADG